MTTRSTADTSKLRDKVQQRAAAGNGGGAVERAQPQHPVQVMLDQYTHSLSGLLPRGMDLARFKRVAWLVVRDNPQLLKADPSSIVAGVFKAAQLGLDLALGHCYLVPFKDNRRDGLLVAQFILGYKGLVTLAHRSGRVLDITGRVVRDGDEFDYDYGTSEFIHHKPVGDPDAPLTHVYAIGRYVNSGRNLEVLTRAQVDKYKARSASARSSTSPWKSDYPAMAMKTGVRRLQPFLPLSVEEAALIDPSEDERVYELQPSGGELHIVPVDDVIDVDSEEVSPNPSEGLDGSAEGGHPDLPGEPVELPVEPAGQPEQDPR